MKAASWPREQALDERLLYIHPAPPGGSYADLHVRDLPRLLRAGDVLVVNDAATMPASLRARRATETAAATAGPAAPTTQATAGPAAAPTQATADLAAAPTQATTGPAAAQTQATAAATFEVRLLRQHRDEPVFTVVLFGAGDWRTPTEHRPLAPLLHVGDTLDFGGAATGGAAPLRANVTWVSPDFPRLCDLRFDQQGAALWTALYQAGRPVQYAYLRDALQLWHVQVPYAARPWAAESPSAGRPLRWELLLALRRAGVGLASLTHGAGLSSTGDEALDAALPLRERYEIPQGTVDAIRAARAGGGRVVAVGTTVVRALEGCAAQHGALVAGPGETELRLDRAFTRRVVDGLLTGMHEPGASHFRLLQAFVSPDLLGAAYAHAETEGYLCHEFGDSSLILPG